MSPSKPVVVRSGANPKVRHLVRMRDNRARRKASRVLVDGWRETAQAFDAGLEMCGVYVPDALIGDPATIAGQVGDHPAIGRLLDSAIQSDKCTWVSDAIMEKIGYGQSSRGVVAEFVEPSWRLDQVRLPASPLVLVLDQIEKPGNIGAVFRSADAAGVDAVLLCDSGDPFSPNAIRSSLGCVFHIRSARGDQNEIAEFLSQQNVRIIAARVESSQSLWSADLLGPLAIVLGNEAAGLGNRWRDSGKSAVGGVRIPMEGSIDSLNVSVAAALIAFEAQRQRASVGRKIGPTP